MSAEGACLGAARLVDLFEHARHVAVADGEVALVGEGALLIAVVVGAVEEEVLPGGEEGCRRAREERHVDDGGAAFDLLREVAIADVAAGRRDEVVDEGCLELVRPLVVGVLDGLVLVEAGAGSEDVVLVAEEDESLVMTPVLMAGVP